MSADTAAIRAGSEGAAVGAGSPRGPLLLATALAFLALALTVTVLWHVVDGGDREVVDITHYQDLGEQIVGGGVPYRDVFVEYPPGSMLSFVPPALVTSSHGVYFVVFALFMAALGVAALLVLAALLPRLGATRRESSARLALVALSPLALGGVVLTRFDLLPALVVLLALLALVYGRERAGFLLLGAAVAIKVYPLVILPVAVAWVWRRRGRKAALTRLAEAIAVPAIAYAAFATLSPGGVGDSLWTQLSRPLQIESLAAGVLLALHQAVGLSLEWSSGAGSQNLNGDAAGALATVSSVAGAAAIVGVWWLFLRGPATTDRLIRFSAASVVAFVTFSKVLSPQYLVWLVFLVPLVVGPGARAALALLAGATVLTGIWFPARYWIMVKEFDPLASWLVLPRGLLLVALLASLLLMDTARGRSRSRSPGPSAHT